MKKLLKFQVRVFAIAAVFLMSFSGILSAQAQIDTIAIIDAGSSGSRLYVYAVNQSGKKLVCLYPKEGQKDESKGKALSSLSNDKESVCAFLNEMTSKYDNTGKPPKDLYVLATAGMRLVDPTTANAIYTHMANSTTSSNYRVKEAMTISGRYEGLYAWIAANYRAGNLGVGISAPVKTLTYTGTPYGIIEIGGASMQITFAANQKCQGAISRTGISNIYSKSYLGGGVDQVYDRVVKSHAMVNDSYNFQVPLDNSSTKHGQVNEFIGLGTPIGIIINGKEQLVGDDHSFRAYAKSLSNKDSEDKYHPYTNAYYVAWLIDSLKLNDKIKAPEKKSDWTEGAAIDIILLKETPEKFNYDMKNPN